jgi:hypothetical protein
VDAAAAVVVVVSRLALRLQRVELFLFVLGESGHGG